MKKRSLTILHIEDDPDIREIAKIALELAGGFDLHQCSTAESALTSARARKFDVFLLDVMMPSMSGPDLLKELRKLPDCQSVPAIFMTARTSEDERSRYLKAGALGVIGKPFDPLKLGAQIETLVRVGQTAA